MASRHVKSGMERRTGDAPNHSGTQMRIKKTGRIKKKSVRFFECAVYARLIGHLRYDIQILAFCALFIIYDVDLVFFLAEATHYEL